MMNKKILSMLNWDNPKIIQIIGITLGRRIKDLSLFMQPIKIEDKIYSKKYWKNCSIILYEKSDEELKKYLPDLFEWIQDINWSGSFRIYFRLKKFSSIMIEEPLIEAIDKAIEKNDVNWLNYISGLIENESIKEILPTKYQNLLILHNKKFWKNESQTFYEWMLNNDLYN